MPFLKTKLTMLAVLLFAAMAGSDPARAGQPGALDPSFGLEHGLTAIAQGEFALGEQLIRLGDGSWVVSGFARLPKAGKALRYRPLLSRFRADGAPESAFGNLGTAQAPIALGQIWASTVLRDGGRLLQVVAGEGAPGTGHGLYVLAYGVDGRVDMTYGEHGVAWIPTGAQNVDAGAVMQDGRVLIAARGIAPGSNAPQPMLVRLDPGGALDASFNGDGIAYYDGPIGTSNYFTDVALQPDGRIVAAGRSIRPGVEVDIAVARFEANGKPDPGFGSDGFQTLDILVNDFVAELLVQGDGRIVLASSSCEGSFNDNGACFLGAARLLADGRPDPSFGGDGVVHHPITASGQPTIYGGQVHGMAIDARGGMVVAGEEFDGDGGYLMRLAADGSVDTTFGGSGVVRSAYGGWTSAVYGVGVTTVDGDPRLVTVGWRQRAGVLGELIIARHLYGDPTGR